MTVSTHTPRRIYPPIVLWAALLGAGLCWGGTQLFAKISVASGHPAMGLVLWQTIIGALMMLAYLVIARRPLPLGRGFLIFYAVCGFLGTAFPHSLSYTYIKHLPVGIASILIAIVPMLTLGLSYLLKVDHIDWKRVLGLLLGTAAVFLILLPEASLPEEGQWLWAFLPLITALSYACENVYIAKAQPDGCDAVQALAGLSFAALLMVVPIAVSQGAWVDLTLFGPEELALIASSVLHILAYFGLVWLISQAGPVFTAQIGYIVTLSGVFFGVIFLGESFAPTVWISLALMMVGLSLVKPVR
ncbi:MAG: DMT family transporter [Pseudomonadota bacterium]